MSTVRTQPIDAFLAEQGTAVTGKSLRVRFGPDSLRRAVGRGTVVRLLPDVYASSLHAGSFDVRAAAAAMWSRGAVSGVAALHLWGIGEAPEVIEVVVPQSRALQAPPWIRVRRVTCEVPQTVRHGIPVVSPAVAVVLSYGQVPKHRRAEVVYGAVRRKLVGTSQLTAVLAAFPRVKARRALERSVAAAAAGAQSFLEEHALYAVFNTGEFSRFVRQHEVVIEGNQFFLDMYDAITRTAVELDGKNGHTDEGRQKDIARDCWVATVGILTLRFSYWDLLNRPEWCRRMVREAVRARTRL